MKKFFNKYKAKEIMNRLFDLFEKTFGTVKRMLFLIFVTAALLLLIYFKGNMIIKIIAFFCSLPIAIFLYCYIFKDTRNSSNLQNKNMDCEENK
jgi:uncharacterized membrane protein YjjP (DUF1212 family)